MAFLGFLLFTSNPFLRLSPAPLEGTELNPLLQDPGLVLHPPLLYLGYVGFSVAFCFAVAALIEGRVDAAWARWVRPWVLAAWIPLTAGITLGSAWAYYELGWGGWWFWDPVENASLMPWLLGTALLHSALVLERRGALVSWTILLAILTFSLSLVGTFLVRSGILTSVHAFAVDPQRGVYILGILAATTGSVAGALQLAGPGPPLRGAVPAAVARRRHHPQQPVPDRAHRHRLPGHLQPGVHRDGQRRQDLGRPAVLRQDLRPAGDPAAGAGGLRPDAELEARRGAARCSAGCASRPSSRASSSLVALPFGGLRRVATAARPGARRLADRGLGCGSWAAAGGRGAPTWAGRSAPRRARSWACVVAHAGPGPADPGHHRRHRLGHATRC